MTSIEIAKRTHCFAEEQIWYELLGQCYSEEEALAMVVRITSAYDDFVHNLGPAKAAEAMKRNGGTMWYIDDLHNNEAPKIGDRLLQLVTTYWLDVLAVQYKQKADAARRQLFPQTRPAYTWESLTEYDEEDEETDYDEYYDDDDEEEEETHATAQNKNKRAGRKPDNIDTLPKMQQKAEELKKIMANKNLPLTVTTTNLCDEVNQCITDFMEQWATERKCLQEPHGTMVGRFLRDVCGFRAEGITWKTWCAHVAPEIPELFKKNIRNKTYNKLKHRHP